MRYMITETVQIPLNEPISGESAADFIQSALPVRFIKASSAKEAFAATCVDVPLTDEVWDAYSIQFVEEGFTVFRNLDSEAHIVVLQ